MNIAKVFNFDEFINESSLTNLSGNEKSMIEGIAEILKQVKDKQNRIEIANRQIENFKKEKIDFDYNIFIRMCNL